jgi:hypothetical protein
MSKSDEKRINAVQEGQKNVEQPAKPAEMKYRYYCDGCTQIALVSTNKMIGTVITCQFCGKTQTAKAENWLPL